MKRSLSVGLLFFVSLVASLALSGCAGSLSFPDSPVESPQNSLGTIQGSVFGGHAPMVGAHVYVLQPSVTGYGNQSTSLLSSTYAGSYATSKNGGGTDGDVPNTWYFVTTDAYGAFGLTGDYTCTVGVPVYLYAYGGSPTLVGTGSPATHTFTVTTLSVANIGTTGTATVTWTTSTPSLFYTGETITGSGFSTGSTLANGDLNTTQIVTGTPAYNQFTTVTVNSANAPNGTYAESGTVTASPQPNPDAVNLATLGVCPSSGNFSTGATALSYVYMNEVSTVATAYAFQPFTSSTANDAFHIGTGSSAQALLGLKNAALTAANLYDIQGSTNSTTYQGEGHIARYVTPAKNGIVSTRVLNTLGNILAACVDSSSTLASPSPACKVLLANATSDGTVNGFNPPDTATAAMYIARYPAGVSNTSFISSLYGLPSATVPFSPALTAAPNDFTVYVQFPNASTAAADGTLVSNAFLGKAESITVDSKGNLWGTAQAGNYSYELSPTGAVQCTYSTNYIFGYLAIDTTDNPWAGNANTTSAITKLSPATSGNTCTSTSYNANTYHQAYTVVNDGSGNTYFMSQNSSGGGAFNIYEFPLGAAPTSSANFISQPFVTGTTIAHASIDNSTGNFWITNENGLNSTFGKVVASTGLPLFPALTTAQLLTTGDGQPEVPAIDHANNAWIPLQNTVGEVLRVSTSGTQVKAITNATSGAKFASSFGAAIDGNGNVWISNRGAGAPYYSASTPGANTIVELTPTGVAISPANNYTLGNILNDSLNLAIDPSGNLWITNYGGGALTEMIGTAAPVVTPISVSSANGSLGAKPN